MRIDFIIALIIIIYYTSIRSLIASKYAAAEDIIVHYSTPLVSNKYLLNNIINI